MTEIDVAKLRSLAEGATPSPWAHQPYHGSGPSGEMMGGDVFGGDGEYLVSEISDDNGAFIAAVEPATVLALLDRLEQAEAAIERERALHKPVMKHFIAWCPTCNVIVESEECQTVLAIAALDTGKEASE